MRNFFDALADACEKGHKTFTLNERNEMKFKVGMFIFHKGSSYQGTENNINEKLDEKSKEHNQTIDANSIVDIDYHAGNNIVFYKYEANK